jgi:N-acetylglucosaminyl-diphospho-decaprenol L-rhamnosyltransferase
MSGAPKLSVLVVTWNVRDLTLACLDALFRHAADVPLEVILVDNASADGTVEAVRTAHPHVTVIANAGNVGFPAANNQALRRARGEYVLFLNPDTEVGPGAVSACVAALDADPSIGMAGCRLVLEDGSTQYECARRPYLLRHLAGELLYLHMLLPHSRTFGDHRLSHWDHLGERDVEAISGAFMLARRDVALGVGGLPDDVFMYHEDLAFCLRVQRAGWRIRYLGDVTTLHRWRASSRRSTAPLGLLEGEVKLRLIREAQGSAAAFAGRGLFTVRSALRLVAAGAANLLPWRHALARRYPRAMDWRMHALQLTWSVAPGRVAHLMPRAEASVTPAGELRPLQAEP